ncbi:hypothetical protein MTR_0032s0190 [Medicago truncatula]|uniref:Uncharacterized protein n=1 Tax=Medicago truncatula TaxID=3880 RepID=A0A072TIH8_MEDTR|nr:hypothetical protein MTR_0032s0190 [Medicago truncatula]
MNIGWIESWSKRKGLGADLVRKYKDSETKIRLPQVRSLARPMPALARPCYPPESLLLLLLRFKLLYFSPQFLVEHSSNVIA